MNPGPGALDALLTGHRAALLGIVAPRPLSEALPEIHAEVERRLPALEEGADLKLVILEAARVVAFRPLVRDEIFRQREAIESTLAPDPADTLPPRTLEEVAPEIQTSAERRWGQVEKDGQLPKLILQAAEEARLWPYVERAKAGDQPDFGALWWKIHRDVMSVIQRTAGWKGDDAVDTAEIKTMTTIQRRLPDYSRDRAFFVSWARGIALRTALAIPPPAKIPIRSTMSDEGKWPIPPAEVRQDLLELAREVASDTPPHRVIAFFYNRYLEWTPAQIEKELATIPLAMLAARLAEDLAKISSQIPGLQPLLRDLQVRVVECADTRLADYCGPNKLADQVSHWATDWTRSLLNRLRLTAKRFLRLVCEVREPPYQRLAFLWCRFLGKSPTALAGLEDLKLLEILERICEALDATRDLSRDRIDWAAGPLKNRIEKDGNPTLRTCSPGNLIVEIHRADRRIAGIVLASAQQEHLLAYAFLRGCFPMQEHASNKAGKQAGGKP